MVPVSCFLETVSKENLVPDVLRTDYGNCLMAGIHCKLVHSTNAHRYGSSISTQRIEHFWSHFKRICLPWAVESFNDLFATVSLILGNILQMECLCFVFSPLIECELDRLTKEWNEHKRRKSNQFLVSGIPDELYFLSESLGYEQCEKKRRNSRSKRSCK